MKKIKILIIDDEPDICFFLKQSLQRTGKYKVLIASGPDIGRWIASCRWHRPDLIILDIIMPHINGFELLKRLRDDRKTMYIPVIMCTALGDMASKIKAEGLYCDDYIVKPVEMETIKAKIEAILAKRGMKVEDEPKQGAV